MMEHLVYIGIGSNLGNRLNNCEKAIETISTSPNMTLLDASSWYRTSPVIPDPTAQEDYCNGIVQISTSLSPRELLQALVQIEAQLGRTPPRTRWAPRQIDLDLLFYDALVLEETGLIIPHPEIAKRHFVLQPLCDIAPAFVHPVLKRTVSELLDACVKEHPQQRASEWNETMGER